MKERNKKGITLIALIITIIVMLILVAISIRIALSTGLFESAGKATKDWETAQDEEKKIASGGVNIGGTVYDSIDDYLAEKAGEKNEEIIGDGSEEKPYKISYIEHLVKIAVDVQNGEKYEGKYFKLTRNLDFNSEDSYIDANKVGEFGDINENGTEENIKTEMTTGCGFLPIGCSPDGSWSGGVPFGGNFDGGNHSITNLYINRPEVCYVGLIGYIEEVEKVSIKNIILNNVDITGGDTVGGVIGCLQDVGTVNIQNCEISGQVNSIYQYSGGICAAILCCNPVSINECINNAKIEGLHTNEPRLNVHSFYGGVVGGIDLEDNASININKCSNSGDIVSGDWGTGGVIGDIMDNSSEVNINITNCFNTGDISFFSDRSWDDSRRIGCVWSWYIGIT